MEAVRILHISDTHGLHRRLVGPSRMPDADILIHTGDFTDTGAPEEIQDFNEWLGEDEQKRYPHRIVIFGNHEYKHKLDPKKNKERITNAVVLEHEEVDVLGLRIFGSPWVPGHKSSAPGDGGGVPHRFHEITPGVDILLTHGGPYGILDLCELGSLPHWGGSWVLREEIEKRARPRVHLFGHMHEQRGVWQHAPGEPFSGRIEYDLGRGKMHPTHAAPPADYPCELISCNAMKNHPGIDRQCGRSGDRCIAGPARLIIAERPDSKSKQPWSFRLADNDLLVNTELGGYSATAVPEAVLPDSGADAAAEAIPDSGADAAPESTMDAMDVDP